MERRFIDQKHAAVRLEQRVDGKPPVIAGLAAVYYDGTPATEYVLWDDSYGRAVEHILPGAFDGAISRPDDVRGLFNHNPNCVLGRTAAGTMAIKTDAKGLNYEIQPGETTVARDVSEHLKRGDVTGSSFSFKVSGAGQKWTSTTDADGKTHEVREITAIDALHDIGPVTFPAYDATTAGLRSAEGVAELRKVRLELNRKSVAAPTPRLNAMRLELAEAGITCKVD